MKCDEPTLRLERSLTRPLAPNTVGRPWQQLMTRLTMPFRLAAWVFIAVLVLLTIAPPSARPDSGVPHHLEHFASFFIAGALWYMGYPRRLLLCLALAVLLPAGWNCFRCWCPADMPASLILR